MKSHIWENEKWVKVEKSEIPEHQHDGKPEDCDRCNAMLHYDLTKRANNDQSRS